MSYGPDSLIKLETCHPDLQRLMRRVDRRWSHTILEGVRDLEQQQLNVTKGVSTTLASKHLLVDPTTLQRIREHADAVDAAPDPHKWPDLKGRLQKVQDLLRRLESPMDAGERVAVVALVRDEFVAYGKDVGRWYAFAGYVHGVADELQERGEITARIRHGYDWDGDHRLDDQSFDDLPHHERVTS